MNIKKKFQTKKVIFHSNGYKLIGTLHLPDVFPERVIVGSHGLASGADSPKQITLAEKCCENGIAFFRFDHRGCGESDGDFKKDTTFDGRSNDLSCAIQTILDRKDVGNRIALFGSSMGGAASISVFDRFDIAAIGVLAAPVSLAQIETTPAEIEDLFGSRALIFQDQLQFDISEKLKKLKNIIIFHGDRDEVVPYKNAEEIYELAGKPKKLVRQTNGDHRMSDVSHQKVFYNEIINWYLDRF